MAVKIRLRRMGAKKTPFYRIVVADSRLKMVHSLLIQLNLCLKNLRFFNKRRNSLWRICCLR